MSDEGYPLGGVVIVSTPRTARPWRARVTDRLMWPSGLALSLLPLEKGCGWSTTPVDVPAAYCTPAVLRVVQ